MRSDYYRIPGPWLGSLATGPRPRGGDWLEDEVRVWCAAGVTDVVSLLTPSEVIELELEAESASCRKNGITFHSMPVPDRGLPPSGRAFDALVDVLRTAVSSGRSVLVHCRQGIGRASLVAVSLLIRAGYDPDAALASVAQARGRNVPDTDEQRDWLRARRAGQAASFDVR